MKLKALKFTKITDFTEFHGNGNFFTEEGQFHGKCHSREIVN